MALSLRRCVCEVVSCDGSEICLLNQILKQRTPQTRASCPDRRSNQEDGNESHHITTSQHCDFPSVCFFF